MGGRQFARGDEAALVERARHDPQAFGELYERYVAGIYAFAYARLNSRTGAEDATSEVFVRALRGLHRYRQTEKPFGAWLYRITANLVADQYRRRRPLASVDDLPDSALPSIDFAEAVLERVARRALWDEVDRLPRQQRMAITLRFCSDQSNADVAQLMDKSTDAIKLLVFRGIRTLRSRLAMASDGSLEQRREVSVRFV